MSYQSVKASPSFYDPIAARLRWAVIASLLVNLVIWRAAASIAKHPPHFDLRPVEITRVVIDQKGHKVEKVITKKQIEHKVAQIRKPKPPLRIVRREPTPVRPIRRPVQIAQKPPEGAHTRVITAKPDPKAPPPTPEDHTALAGGNAAVGKAIEQQNPGNATTNPPEPVKTQPETKPEPAPAPVKTQPEPAPAPVIKQEPKPEPPPQPAPETKPKGPTRDAEPDLDSEVKPDIPDDLKHGDYKSFVRVKVTVAEDGSFTIDLYKSSGNTEIDNRVLAALNKWKWKPALRNGVPGRERTAIQIRVRGPVEEVK